MKRPLVFAVMIGLFASANAQDVREAARKAADDRARSEQSAREAEERILNDRAALQAEVEKLEAQERELENALAALESEIKAGGLRLDKLEDDWSKVELDFQEISGNVRVAGRDLETILTQSPLSALAPQRLTSLRPLLRKGYFPDIDDIVHMTDLYFDEIRRSGQVSYQKGPYVGRDGEDRSARILSLGKFTNIYRDGDEVGFLNYSAESQRFFALSTLPSGRIASQMDDYTRGESDMVPIDISGGAALRQVSHKQSLLDQLRAGGPIVWPIAAIALFALLIVFYKIFFLNTVHRNTGKYMPRATKFAEEGNWDEAENLVARHKGEGSPVNHVLEAGIKARREDRETLESILQESILRELPRVERGLSVLAILGAVAPLLGLLGTVTGMIDTFRVITLFGTGDPKLMSGGISEALVTTELGLAVAIPIMLLHTFLSRRVDHIIGEMEENAVALTNTILKQRSEHERNAVASA